MLALKIILGIILFFVLVLSVKVKVSFHSEDGIDLSIRWLFLNFRILPKKEKKKPKKKKKKKEKKKKEKEKDEKVKEPKEKKDNIFVRFYHNNGVSGVMELLRKVRDILAGMFRRIARSFTIEEIFISLLVGAGDSAETAIKYGKTCSEVYPIMGYIVDTMRVKKYNLEVSPDFVYSSNKARLHGTISVIPRRLINAIIIVGVELVFKVVIKFLKGSKVRKTETGKEEENTNKN